MLTWGVHMPSPHRRFPPRHYIGYEHAADIAAEAVRTGRTVREVAGERTDLPAEQLDEILDPIRLARGLGQTCREHRD